LDIIKSWNKRNDPEEKGAAIFKNWLDSVEVEIYLDELSKVAEPFDWPEQYTMVETLLRDSAYSFVDNINTPNLETTVDVVMAAFKKIIPVV